MKKSEKKKKFILNKMSIVLLDYEDKTKIKSGRKLVGDVLVDDAPGTVTCKTDYVPICPESVVSTAYMFC